MNRRIPHRNQQAPRGKHRSLRPLRSLLLLLLVLGGSKSAEPIAGVGDLVFDIAVQFETALVAINTAMTVAMQVIDLTPLDEVIVADGYAEDMTALGQLVDSAQGLAFDVSSLQAQVTALFALDGAPMTSWEYRERMQEIRVLTWQGYSYAMRTQTLISTIRRTIEHAVGLVDAVGGLIGTLQSGQTASQAITKLVQLESEMQVSTIAYQRAHSVDAMSDQLILQSIQNINEAVWSKEP